MSCHRQAIFKDEIRPFEGEIFYLYVNDSLDFSLSLYGGMRPVLNPRLKDVKKSVGVRSYKYNLTNDKIKYLEDILLANDCLGIPAYQLFQVYKIVNHLELEPFVEAYKNTLLKSVLWIQDIPKVVIDSTNFYTIRYSTKSKTSYTNIAESFFLKKNHLIRLIFFRIEQSDCCGAETLEDFDATTIISTFIDRKLSNKPKLGVVQLFINSKFNYLEPLNRLSDTNVRNANMELLSTYYSFVGDIKNTLKFEPVEKAQSTLDTHYVSAFSVKDAETLLDYVPDTCQVIMVNEDHFNPYSRIFMETLLEPLRNKGFNAFASETLVTLYDTISYTELKQGTGFYSAEPNYGNLLRSALSKGYKIFSYENSEPYNDKIGVKRAEFREYQQAKNLSNLLKDNKECKLIVFAGHDHIKKNNPNSVKMMMAQHFKELTGITPFCIEQTTMTEAYNRENENPYYTYIENKYRHTKSIILTSKEGLFVEPRLQNSVDVQVFHPRTEFDNNGYPLWNLRKGNNEQQFSFRGKEFSNAIFQVFKTEEYEKLRFDAVPILNLPLNGQNEFKIYLPNGRHSILVFDRYRNVLYNKQVSFP
jgi:uncharacterized HAD superfamily protein